MQDRSHIQLFFDIRYAITNTESYLLVSIKMFFLLTQQEELVDLPASSICRINGFLTSTSKVVIVVHSELVNAMPNHTRWCEHSEGLMFPLDYMCLIPFLFSNVVPSAIDLHQDLVPLPGSERTRDTAFCAHCTFRQ